MIKSFFSNPSGMAFKKSFGYNLQEIHNTTCLLKIKQWYFFLYNNLYANYLLNNGVLYVYTCIYI